MTPDNASSYFSKADYYINGNDSSLWLGQGASVLGLAGPIKESDFRAIADGCHPVTGEQLISAKTAKDSDGKLIDTHRAGNDLTFSAPKSLSVAYAAGAEELKAAHDNAVKAVVAHIEKYYSQYRSSEGIEQADNLIAAKFNHVTSRDLDPQLHSHIFVLNAVIMSTGEWKANEPLNIYRDQKALGVLFRQELANQLQLLGYQLEYSDRGQMLFEIVGVEESIIQHFSQRRVAIESQVAEWRETNKFPDASDSRLFEMANLKTRVQKDNNLNKSDILAIWDKRFAEAGASKEAILESIQKHRRIEHLQPDKSAAEIVQAAATFLSETEAVIDRCKLLDTATKISGGNHGITALSSAIDAHASSGIVKIGSQRGRKYYSTRAMQQLELRNLQSVKSLTNSFISCTSSAEVEAYLNNLQTKEKIILSLGQRQHIINELTGRHGVAVTQGDAGTGKTFASKIIERFVTEVLIPSGRGHDTVNIAFTGKAALEMHEASGRPSYTIDAFLNAYHNGKVTISSYPDSNSPPEHRSDELHIPTGQQIVLRVDEASFVGARQAELLLNVVRDLQAKGVQTKILFTGDTKQMQAITSGDLFRQAQRLAKTSNADFAHLTEIIRQKDVCLRQIAINLNREDRPLADNATEAIDALHERNAVTEISDREKLIQAAAERYLSASNSLSHDSVKAENGIKASTLLVAATNADRKELNQTIRDLRINRGEIEPGITRSILTSVQQPPMAAGYRIGQQVLFSGYRGNDGKMRAWGARLQQEGRITGIDIKKNTVTVQYAYVRNGIDRTISKELPAEQLALNTTIYSQEERQFSAGDRIVFLKNDNGLGVKNGSFGIIDSIDESGNTAVILDSGKQLTFNLSTYRSIDHAYAVTIHKAQGATVEHCIMFSYVKPDHNHQEKKESDYGHASYNGLNVAVTRAQYCSELFTNSIDGLKNAVRSIDIKTSTLNFPQKQTTTEVRTQANLKTKINCLRFSNIPAIAANVRLVIADKINALAAKVRNPANPAHQKGSSQNVTKLPRPEIEIE